MRVLSVEIETGEPSIPAGHLRVRAIVHLGRLTPADVHVQATLARALADDLRREVQAARLWSAQSYRNGVYVFEGHMAEPMLDDPERLRVLIEPRERPY